MSDDPTKPLTLEQKVDLILARLDALEAKTFDTRPIWERALAEILEVKTEVLEVKDRMTRFEVRLRAINKRWLDFEGELGLADDRIDKIEKHVGLSEEFP